MGGKGKIVAVLN